MGDLELAMYPPNYPIASQVGATGATGATGAAGATGATGAAGAAGATGGYSSTTYDPADSTLSAARAQYVVVQDASVDITLPASPTNNDIVDFMWGNNLGTTIRSGSQTLRRASDGLDLGSPYSMVNNTWYRFVYRSSDDSWYITGWTVAV